MLELCADTSVGCGEPATSCLLLADLAVNFARSIVSSAGPLVRERCAYAAGALDAHTVHNRQGCACPAGGLCTCVKRLLSYETHICMHLALRPNMEQRG